MAYPPGTCDVSQAPAPEWPKAADCLPAPDSPLVGSWRGHWPDPNALNNNQDATLTIAGLTADGTPCGTFTVGEGPELPAPTDAAEYYPPYSADGAGGGPASGVNSRGAGPYSGHAYPLMNVQSSGARLAFGYGFTDPWRSWCGLQTPEPGTGLCADPVNSTITPDNRRCFSGKREISCAQYFLCAREQMCRCNDTCCDAHTDGTMAFELHWDNGALEGTVTSFDTLPIFLDPVPKAAP